MSSLRMRPSPSNTNKPTPKKTHTPSSHASHNTFSTPSPHYMNTSNNISSGKAWLGFTVQPRGNALIIQGVHRNGPAAVAGIFNGDQLVNIAGREVKDVPTFRRLFREFAVDGRTVSITIRKTDGSISTRKLYVTTKRQDLSNVHHLVTISDLRDVLRSTEKLDNVSKYLFQECDEDLSGLVSKTELTKALRRWLTPEFSRVLQNSDISRIFEDADANRSGYLSRSEFPELVDELLKFIIRNYKEQPRIEYVEPPPAPVYESQTRNIETYTRVTNEKPRNDLLVNQIMKEFGPLMIQSKLQEDIDKPQQRLLYDDYSANNDDYSGYTNNYTGNNYFKIDNNWRDQQMPSWSPSNMEYISGQPTLTKEMFNEYSNYYPNNENYDNYTYQPAYNSQYSQYETYPPRW